MFELTLGRYISLIYRYGQMFITEQLEPYRIGHGQFLFLMVLYRKDGLTQEELARNLNIHKGTTTRAVRKLEQSGYVRREQDQTDLRANRVFLTEKAIKFEPVLADILNRWTRILGTGLTDEEFKQAFNLLTRMAQSAVNYMREEKGN